MWKFILTATTLFIVVSPACLAQGKLYIVPKVGFYVGAYRGKDSINNKQNFIKSPPFLSKDFSIGLHLDYVISKWTVGFGIESGFYTSAYKHTESKELQNRVNSMEALSQADIWVYHMDGKYNVANIDIFKPKRWRPRGSKKPYLIVTDVVPFAGVELRRLGQTFVQDFVEGSRIGTSMGNIPGTNYYHSFSRHHWSMRAGVDWIFYDGEKRRFQLQLMYKFAFTDAGYFHYHFEKPSRNIDFQYRVQTRGNGFSIMAGIPIGVWNTKAKEN